jgi:hypothetical protein
VRVQTVFVSSFSSSLSVCTRSWVVVGALVLPSNGRTGVETASRKEEKGNGPTTDQPSTTFPQSSNRTIITKIVKINAAHTTERRRTKSPDVRNSRPQIRSLAFVKVESWTAVDW